MNNFPLEDKVKLRLTPKNFKDYIRIRNYVIKNYNYDKLDRYDYHHQQKFEYIYTKFTEQGCPNLLEELTVDPFVFLSTYTKSEDHKVRKASKRIIKKLGYKIVENSEMATIISGSQNQEDVKDAIRDMKLGKGTLIGRNYFMYDDTEKTRTELKVAVYIATKDEIYDYDEDRIDTIVSEILDGNLSKENKRTGKVAIMIHSDYKNKRMEENEMKNFKSICKALKEMS